MVQQYKVDAVSNLKDRFDGVRNFIFADYRGLTVDQISELRGALREVGAEFRVVKNSYAKIAFKQMDVHDVESFFVGPTAITYCGEDVGPVAKILLRLSKTMSVELKGGLLDGSVYDSKSVGAFSALPTRMELIQLLMGTMKAPVSNMVYALDGIGTKLVRVLDAIREKKSQDE